MPDKRTGRARQGTHPTAPRPTLIGGHRALYKTSSGQAAQKVLTQAAKNGQRVDMAVKDKSGHLHDVVNNRWRGHTRPPGKHAAWVKKQTGGTSKSVKVFAAQQTELGDPAQSDAWGKPVDWFDITELQITVYL